MSGLTPQFKAFFRWELAGGSVLLACTALTLVVANSPFQTGWAHLWEGRLYGSSLRYWINEGLMTLFFLAAGLEIKREILTGELSTLKKALLPGVAALGGMVFPALIYLAFNWGTSGQAGWGIPVATDIAFAVGVLSILGSRISASMKVFLTALAIADDIGAMVIVAIFYGTPLHWPYVGLSLALISGLASLKYSTSHSPLIWIPLGVLLWVIVGFTGLHSSLTGVVMAILLPPSLDGWERVLIPLSSFVIIPLFALANAGVSLSGLSWAGLLHPVSVGIMCGYVLGKPLGIALFSWGAVTCRLASLPPSMRVKDLWILGCLGGIGFTMSLFIAQLAFSDPVLDLAKMAIPLGSFIAACLGAVLCWLL